MDYGCCGSKNLPMRKMASVLKKYNFILPLIFIFGISYLRYTYILHPNFNGEAFLIKIKLVEALDNQEATGLNTMVSIKSIIIFWVLFFLGNVALFFSLFSSIDKVKTIGFFYLLISFFSVVFLALYFFWFKSPSLFSLGSILKNFLLSPLFTAIAYIMTKYLHWFGKPS